LRKTLYFSKAVLLKIWREDRTRLNPAYVKLLAGLFIVDNLTVEIIILNIKRQHTNVYI